MCQTTADVNSLGSVAGPTNGRLLSPATAIVGTLLALGLDVLASRFLHLRENPPGALLDEGIHRVNALQVLRGEHAALSRKA